MKLVPVQVLRAAAALAVAMLHGQHEAGLLAAASGRNFRPLDLLPWQAGVDVFFVVSGFVMVFASRPLFGRGWARAGLATRIFLARRVARIVPLYWLTTTLYLALALASPALVNGTPEPGFVLASYAFWPAMRPDGVAQPLYSLGWTLNYEMFFYLLFALALPLRRRWAVFLAAAALAGLVVWVQAFGASLPLAYWGDPIVLEFAFGMALGLARAEGVLLPPGMRAAFGAVGIALFAGVAAGLFAGAPRVLAFGVPAACLVAACGLGREHALAEETWIVRFGTILGDASYALYLIHPFVIRGLRQIVQAAGLDAVLASWPFVLVALVAVIGASVATYSLVERPLTAALRGLLEPRPNGAPERA